MLLLMPYKSMSSPNPDGAVECDWLAEALRSPDEAVCVRAAWSFDKRAVESWADNPVNVALRLGIARLKFLPFLPPRNQIESSPGLEMGRTTRNLILTGHWLTYAFDVPAAGWPEVGAKAFPLGKFRARAV